MEMSILGRLCLWKEPLQLQESTRVLTTSLETFHHIVSIIEGNNDLSRKLADPDAPGVEKPQRVAEGFEKYPRIQ
jgi:hypothetical protein